MFLVDLCHSDVCFYRSVHSNDGVSVSMICVYIDLHNCTYARTRTHTHTHIQTHKFLHINRFIHKSRILGISVSIMKLLYKVIVVIVH